MDQAALTGESLPVTKYTGGVCYSGSYITQGTTEAVVYATGVNTFFGKVASILPPTPTAFKVSESCLQALFDEAKVFPRQVDLSAIKKLNVMAFDKTGVLTLNKLAVSSIGLLGDDGIKWIPSDQLASHELKEVARTVLRCCSAANHVQLDAINYALDQWSHEHGPELGVDPEELKKPSAFFPFDPVTKYLAIVYDGQSNNQKKKKKKKGKEDAEVKSEEKEGKQEPFGFARGAAQLIFKRCNSVMINGEMKRVADLPDIEGKISEAINGAAERGWRTLGLVLLEGGLDPSANIEGQDEPLGNISCWKTSCFLGLVPFVDPLRKDAPEHVRQLAEMGMKILILTGDAISITKEVARGSLGWKLEDWKEIPRGKDKKPQQAKGELLEAKEAKRQKSKKGDDEGEKENEGNKNEEKKAEETSFRAFCMTPDDLDELEKEDNYIDALSEQMNKFDGMIFAQVYPEHKYTLVAALQKAGFVVGMVGDGVNDAPVMKKADVRFAPTDATNAAKSVADFIMREPDLGGIVRTIEILRHEKEKDGKCVLS